MTSLTSHLPELLVAAGFALILIIALTPRPKVFAVTWLAAICFVPWWVGVPVHQFYPVAVIISLLGLFCMTPRLMERVTVPDWGVLALFLVCLLPVLVGGSTTSATFGAAAVWLPAYLVGRRLPARVDLRWLYGAVAVIFSIVSILAIAEFAFSWNPFIGIHQGSASSYATWATLQQRGGELRTEGAFGHSIALSCSLALAIPMTLASRFGLGPRVIAVGLMLGASVTTFSRTGVLCAVASLVVSIVFLRDIDTRRLRYAVSGLVLVMSLFLVPLTIRTFTAAGTEASRSADYRDKLVTLLSQINWVGISDAAQRAPNGDLYFGTFRSIDSQLILTGVTYGAFALVVACLLLIGGIALVLIRRASAPLAAVVCQIPALATVALITQYSVFLWFVIGLAVAAQADLTAREADSDQSSTRSVSRSTPARGDIVTASVYPAATSPV